MKENNILIQSINTWMLEEKRVLERNMDKWFSDRIIEFNSYPFKQYLEYPGQVKGQELTIEFDIIKPTFLDKILQRKTKVFISIPPSLGLLMKTWPMMSELINNFSWNRLIDILVMLLFGNENQSERKLKKLKKFLEDNTDINEITDLFELLIKNSGCFVLNTLYPEVKKQIN